MFGVDGFFCLPEYGMPCSDLIKDMVIFLLLVLLQSYIVWRYDCCNVSYSRYSGIKFTMIVLLFV